MKYIKKYQLLFENVNTKLNFLDLLKLPQFCIRIHNENEYIILMIELEKKGYKWLSEKNPTDIGWTRYIEIIWINNIKKILTYSSFMFYFSDFKFEKIKLLEFEDVEIDKNHKIKKIKNLDLDPYCEEDWGYVQENKINELFETKNVYDFKLIKKRDMFPFVDYIYTFTSRDNIEYYVTLSHNKDNDSMSVKFTDKKNFIGIRNKIKDKYVNMNNFDAINVLNTVVKICKDFYDENSDIIKKFTTSTLDEKRLRVYKYILKKYFKDWEVDSYIDPRGDIVIECKPKINEKHEDVDPYGEEEWDEPYEPYEYGIGDDVVCVDTRCSMGLTVGKTYKVLDVDDLTYSSTVTKIINDDGKIANYVKTRFKKLN